MDENLQHLKDDAINVLVLLWREFFVLMRYESIELCNLCKAYVDHLKNIMFSLKLRKSNVSK